MTTVYNYSKTTGEYLASNPAMMDPRRPDVALIPAHATEVAPPSAPEGQVAVFADGAWSLVEDRRGVIFWMADGFAAEMSDLGPLPDGAITDAPPSAAHRWTGSAWEVPPAYRSADAAKSAIVDAIERAETALASRRSWGELQSWREQEPAALAVLSGDLDHPGIPMIDAIRAPTGETREGMAEVIAEQAGLFRSLIGPLIGIRRGGFAAIDAAADLTEVEAAAAAAIGQVDGLVAAVRAGQG